MYGTDLAIHNPDKEGHG